ncbi:MAG: sigma-70 family RNA polymerase sigma factor [Thermoleophilia bacterium]|nr:sigma-70 family RNA polymerase sigma factor [Thermoleophilia bacterium]
MPATKHLPFQPFYVAHRAAVLRLLTGMVGASDAADCFQDTWLKVLRAWPPAAPDGRLDSWVLTIAHRTAIDCLRRRGAQVPVEFAPEQPAPVIGDDDQLLALGPGELHAAVASLGERQRAAVLLRVVVDLSHAQVAEVLGCSVDAARRTYADAIANLRRTLEVDP